MKLSVLNLARLLIMLVLLAVASAGRAQQPAGDRDVDKGDATLINWADQKTPVIHGFVAPTPAVYMKAIDDHREVVRAKIVLDGATTVVLSERPKDIDFYDSTVQVERKGQPIRSYKVGEMIRHQALSLAHVALVPAARASGMLVCEYEGGAVGARVGFAILRFSQSGFELHTLPLTDFGKVVVFRGRQERAEIWTALADYVGSDADPRVYATRVCNWGLSGFTCGPPKRQPKTFAPGAINDPGIEIRP